MALSQHVLGHTNGRLGFTFANQVIDVVELIDLEANITVHPVLTGEAEITPVLTGSIYVDKDE